MSSGRKEARRAREQAEQSAEEARRLRADISRKEKEERVKVQRKLIRGIRGRFNPFEVLPGSGSTLGGSSQQES